MKSIFKLFAIFIAAIILTNCAANDSINSPVKSPIESHAISSESSVEPILTPSPTPSNVENTSHRAKRVDIDCLKDEDFLTTEEAAALLDQKVDKDTPLDIPVYSTFDLLYNNHSFHISVDPCRFNAVKAVRFDNSEFLFTEFPTNAWRTLDNGFIYCQYLTDNGDKMFLFFKDSDDEYDRRYYVGFPILMSHSLSYSDFKPIKIGDDIEEVSKVDDVIDYYLPCFEQLNDDYLNNVKAQLGIELHLTSVHLLKDGILKYEYQRNIEDDKSQYTISDIEYHEDFMLKSASGTINYQIAEMDYVE